MKMLRLDTKPKDIFTITKDARLNYHSESERYVMFQLLKHGGIKCKRHFKYYYDGALHDPYFIKKLKEVMKK